MARRTTAPFTILGTFAVFGIMLVTACHGPGPPRRIYPGMGGPTLDWALDTAFIIGDVTRTDPDYTLIDVLPVGGFAGDERGDLFVLDKWARKVLTYDSSGSHVTTYSLERDELRELPSAVGLSAGRGDTIWVQDVLSRRLAGVPVAGGEPRFLGLPDDQYFRLPLVPRPGVFVAEGRPRLVSSRWPGKIPRRLLGFLTLLSISDDGSRVDTLWSCPEPDRELIHFRSAGAGTTLLVTPTFAPTLRWDAFADGSIAVSDDDTYTVHLLRPDGSEWMRFGRDLPPRPVTDHDRDVARSRIRAHADLMRPWETPFRRGVVEKRLETLSFAPTVPRITGIRVDGADRVWVGVSLAEPDSTERIDVFERDGTLLGSIEGLQLPTLFFASDRAAVLGYDPVRGQHVVVLRLREGAR